MDNIRIEPADTLSVGDIVDMPGVPGGELLKYLSVKSINIDPEKALWEIDLDVLDAKRWAKTASSHEENTFKIVLASARQEILKKVIGLEKIRWVIPDLTGTFKAPEPEAKQTSDKPPRRRNETPLTKEDATPLNQITGGERGRVTVCGMVVNVKHRQNAAGKFDTNLIITDYDDSIKVRLPYQSSTRDDITPGCFVLARGKADIDRFDSDPVIVVTRKSDIDLTEPVIREDTAPTKRVELHLHTKMSAIDSVLEVSQAIERARMWGHPAIAITDHGVVQAFPEAGVLGKKLGIKIIYGVEGYLVDDHDPKGPSHHIVILAKNRIGLRHLYELITESHLEHFYRTPRIPRNALTQKREGLLLGSACEAGELIKAILSKKPDPELLEIASFYDYLEIQPLSNNDFLVDRGVLPDRSALENLNRKIYELSKKCVRPCVMTSDAHCLDPHDRIYRTVLLSVKGMTDEENKASLHFRTTDELLAEASSYLGQDAANEVVVTNSNYISDMIDDLLPVPEGSFFPTLQGADKVLETLTYKGAHEIYGEELPMIVQNRLQKELKAIIGNGYASLYIIAIRMVQKSNEDGYLVGSRGSVGSSLVATCTGITEVNPLKPHYICANCKWSEFPADSHCGSGFDMPPKLCSKCGLPMNRDGQDIPFETFMGFHGEKVPDIDLNFSGEEQGAIFRFAEELLGKDNVFRAGTIGTIARKTAFGFVKNYQESQGKTFRRAEETRLIKGIEGVKRTTGQHPGGVMVVPQGMDILDFTPIQYPADDREAAAMTTHFDYHSISGRLVKVDILGHDDPTVLKMLHELTGVDPTQIPMDDPETLKIFSGDSFDASVGVPEFGTRFVRNMLADTRPRCFSDLVRISGLSHGTDVWANNARDLIRDNTANLQQVISSREDIFLHLAELGVEEAHSFAIAEKVRKGQPLAPEDVQAMKAVNVPQWYIESCAKISYLFPKAHAAAYVTTAFRIAYFKVHHVEAFAAAYFTFHGSSFSIERIAETPNQWKEFIERINSSSGAKAKEQDIATALEVALEMNSRGITFLKPCAHTSDTVNYIPQGSSLLMPFTSIPGLGEAAAKLILSAREENAFTSIDDFRRRTKTGKKMMETLRGYGLFKDLPEGEQPSLF